MKKVKILSFDKVDSVGDLFPIGSVKWSHEVMLTHNFDHTKPLGKVEVSQEKDGLYTELDESKFKGLTPAIGFQVIDSELREDGVTVFKEIKLEYVGLCMNENLDPEIKPL